jgi:hypothetical protein
MAIPVVKSTYVLDVETAQTLERLAKDWQVSKSEALRRLIRSAATTAVPDRVAVLRRLQESVKLSRSTAERWVEAARSERRSSGRRTTARRLR